MPSFNNQVITAPELVCEFFTSEDDYQRPLPNVGWANEPILGTLPFTGDCEIQFTYLGYTNNTAQMIGLNSDPNTDANHTSLDYCLYLYVTSGVARLYARENGLYKALVANPLNVGSTASIRRIGQVVQYLVDGAVQYTSLIPSVDTLYADSSFYSTTSGFWSDGQIELEGVKLCQI